MGRIYKLRITLTFIFIFLNKTDDFSCKNYNQFSHDNNKKKQFFLYFWFCKNNCINIYYTLDVLEFLRT